MCIYSIEIVPYYIVIFFFYILIIRHQAKVRRRTPFPQMGRDRAAVEPGQRRLHGQRHAEGLQATPTRPRLLSDPDVVRRRRSDGARGVRDPPVRGRRARDAAPAKVGRTREGDGAVPRLHVRD